MLDGDVRERGGESGEMHKAVRNGGEGEVARIAGEGGAVIEKPG